MRKLGQKVADEAIERLPNKQPQILLARAKMMGKSRIKGAHMEATEITLIEEQPM